MKRPSLKCPILFCFIIFITFVRSTISQNADNDLRVEGSMKTAGGTRENTLSDDVSATESITYTNYESATVSESLEGKGDEKLFPNFNGRERGKFCICDCNKGDTIAEDTENDRRCVEIKGKDINILNEIDPSLANVLLKSTEREEEEKTFSNNTDNPEITTHSVLKAGEIESAVARNEPDIVTAMPLGKCEEEGDFINENNCHSYFTCKLSSSIGSLQRIDKLCPPKTAFSVELGRCTRDISVCNNSIVCTVAGIFSDNNSNASYYWCVARPLGGFRLYHIDCKMGRVFVPQLGKCFIDINNLQSLPANYNYNDDDDDEGAEDEVIVKAELKQLKVADKVKAKEQKVKEKLEKRLKKELARKAAKETKEQAKLKKGL